MYSFIKKARKMSKILGMLKQGAETAIGGLPGAAVGMGLNVASGIIQNAQQRKMMEEQKKNQLELMAKSQEYQKGMWDYTNYENQIKHMKDAGLNPALAYGMGGGGGATVGSSGGSATGGMAAHIGTVNPMDIAQQQANIEAMKANANKSNAEADAIRGYKADLAGSQTDVNRANLGLIEANTGNAKADQQLTEARTRYQNIQTSILDQTKDFDVNRARWECNKAEALMKNAWTDAYVNDQTKEEQIKTAKANRIAVELANELQPMIKNKLISETGLNNQKILESAAGIQQAWEKLQQSGQQVNIESFKAMLQATQPGIQQVLGKGLDKGTKLITTLFGILEDNTGWDTGKGGIPKYELHNK